MRWVPWPELVAQPRPIRAPSLSPWAVRPGRRARRAGARRRPPVARQRARRAGSGAARPPVGWHGAGRPADRARMASPSDALAAVPGPVERAARRLPGAADARAVGGDRPRCWRSSPTRSARWSARAASGCARRSCTGAIAPPARARRRRGPPPPLRPSSCCTPSRCSTTTSWTARPPGGAARRPTRPWRPAIDRAVGHGDADWFGTSAAILAGDLVTCGPTSCSTHAAAAERRLDRPGRCSPRLREEVIAGQYLDLRLAADRAADEMARAARRAAEVGALHGHPATPARRRARRPLAGARPRRSGPDRLRRRRGPRLPAPRRRPRALRRPDASPARAHLDDLREGKRTLLMLRALGWPTTGQRPRSSSRARRSRRSTTTGAERVPRDRGRHRRPRLRRGAHRQRTTHAPGARRPSTTCRATARVRLTDLAHLAIRPRRHDPRRRRRRRPRRPVGRLPPRRRGHEVTVVEAGDARRPGRHASARRLPVRHRPDRADDARTWSSAASRPPASTARTAA